jgi:tRNA uridine 5-carboxymethylaminomethyl modification enzyme
VGLISEEAWADFQTKQDRLAKMKALLECTRLTPAMLEQHAETANPHVETAAPGCPAEQSSAARAQLSAAIGQTLAQLLKRPEVTVEQLVPMLRELTPEFFTAGSSVPSLLTVAKFPLSSQLRNELKSVETEIKYEGYLLQQQRAMERLKKSEQHTIPDWFDYHSVSGLSREMQEKLTHVRPRTIGQASRIPGVTPAAVSLVNVFIEIQARKREQAAAI